VSFDEKIDRISARKFIQFDTDGGGGSTAETPRRFLGQPIKKIIQIDMERDLLIRIRDYIRNKTNFHNLFYLVHMLFLANGFADPYSSPN